MSMLDHSKPFQQFFPPHEGATFEQDGQRYDADGRPIGEKKSAGKAPKAPVATASVAADPSQAQLDQQLAG